MSGLREVAAAGYCAHSQLGRDTVERWEAGLVSQ